MSGSPVVERVRSIVAPIASDLDLDLYDVEQRGGTMRVTLDTRPGSESGIDLDQLALATRLISRELDHQDPIPGRYTLEVTSPGLERDLRTAAHFRREIGKTVRLRLADVTSDERRLEGVLVAADDTTATIRLETDGETVERTVELTSIDRAKTVFVWEAQPKRGGKGVPKKRKQQQPRAESPATGSPAGESRPPSQKESS